MNRLRWHLALSMVFCSVWSIPVLALAQDATPVASGAVTTIVSGLTNPRGFVWGPDGTLYLTLAGTGGDVSGTIDGADDGIFGGPSSSVVTVVNGCAEPFIDGIPSGNWRDAGWIWGAHDAAFLDGTLYILSAGGGTDFGNPDQPAGVLRVEADGSTTVIADFSAWSPANPASFISPDYNPSGSLFDMEPGTDRLWISDAVGGRILTVTPDGEITLVADISAGHPVPTGLALAPDGGLYVGTLTALPFVDGTAKVLHISPDGIVTDYWTGLTAVNDVAIGPDGELYAVEMATGNLSDPPFARPNSGRVVRMTGPTSFEEVVIDAEYPGYIAFGADDALYLTLPAFGDGDGVGLGSLVSIDITSGAPVSLAGYDPPAQTCTNSTPVATTGA